MTQDEQEALSFRYVMPRVMRLSSGRFALFIDGQDLQIVDGHTLLSRLPDCEALAAYNESLRTPRPGRISDLNLADLGL